MRHTTSFSINEARDARYDAVPLEIGSWTGRDTPLDERTYEILETRNVLSRFYTLPSGEQVHLLLVGSNKDRRVAHPPEVCYLSSHYEISRTRSGTFQEGSDVIPFKEFTAQDQRKQEPNQEVLYFYRVGDRYTDNYYSQQLQFAWDRLARKETEILLVRVASTTPEVLQGFLKEVLPHLSFS